MWKVTNYKGEQIYYEAELIEKIKTICIKRPYQALDKILDLIQENEK